MNYIIFRLKTLHWPIHYKIGLAFTLVLLSFVANGVISILLLLNIQNTNEQQRTNAVYSEQVQRLQLAYLSEVQEFSNTIWLTKLALVSDSFSNIITTELDEPELANITPASRTYRANLNKLYQLALDHFKELQLDLRNSNFDLAQSSWRQFQPDFEKVTITIKQWQEYIDTERSLGQKTLSDTIFLSVTMLISLTVFSILLALGLLYLIGRVLVNPLNSLQKALQQMAGGNLDQQLEIVNRDEIGSLAQSFKQAQQALRKVLSGLQIGESLQVITGQLATVSKQQTAGSNEQVIALAQVGAAMQELGRTASQIAESAVQVAALTGTTVQQIERVAEAGKDSQLQAHQMAAVVESALSGVERVGYQVNEFSEVMSGLNRQAEAIGKVVELLGGVTEQVHLLALNAAIEASGAGPYGERFRMVAREIKLLAKRSNQATEEARQLISEVQKSNREALAQINQGRAEVSSVVEANSGLRQHLQSLETSAVQVSESVALLMGVAEQVSGRAEEIKQATQQQRQSSEQVIYSARSVGAVAEQTASATHQIASSSLQLESLTNQLNGILSQVRLAA